MCLFVSRRPPFTFNQQSSGIFTIFIPVDEQFVNARNSSQVIKIYLRVYSYPYTTSHDLVQDNAMFLELLPTSEVGKSGLLSTSIKMP